MRSKLRSAALFAGGGDGGSFGIAYLFQDEIAGLAAHAAHRIDHALVGAVQRPFDRLVEPAVDAPAIDEPRRKSRGRADEGEDRVLVLGRGAREPERRLLPITGE